MNTSVEVELYTQRAAQSCELTKEKKKKEDDSWIFLNFIFLWLQRVESVMMPFRPWFIRDMRIVSGSGLPSSSLVIFNQVWEVKSRFWSRFGQWESLQSHVETSVCVCVRLWYCTFQSGVCLFIYIYIFLKLQSLILFTHQAYVMYVYRWPSALRFGGRSGKSRAAQVKWVALRCSLYRERWAVHAQLLCYVRWSWQRWHSVFSHRYSVLQRWEKITQKAAVGMEK